MVQQAAVIIIARHGPRLDAADQNWHLTTPTPYDPPLTFGGWNQCRSLGVRIASLLYTREQSLNNQIVTGTTELPTHHGVTAHDFAGILNKDESLVRRSKRRKHKVVIHTSPFLRCVQSSVAIAAGIAQFVPPISTNNVTKSTGPSRGRTPNQLHSMSPRQSASELPQPTLLHVPESKLKFGHEISRRVAQEHKKHHRAKLRVDAFLGEWLNPEYFDHITPPPPSSLMLATAKAELMHNETIDTFTPTITTKSSRSSLWGGGSNDNTRPHSRDSALDDWDDVHDVLPPTPTDFRNRTSSHSSATSNDSGASRRNVYRLSHQPMLGRNETMAYTPPTPTYAYSSSDHIPKGYVSHARNNCTNVDYHWDSSRPPQDWGDGGEYGEEWSLMHRRFRHGLMQLVSWYSQHSVDDRGEDALGFDQAEKNHDDIEDEEEDLVVILVTHGAGCNALIGALTGQPVLMDVGMASLTMAVRKDEISCPETSSPSSSPEELLRDDGKPRTTSQDLVLTSMYDLKIIASSEHLRQAYDPHRPIFASTQRTSDPPSRLRPMRHESAGSSLPTLNPTGNSVSTALGSIRRPPSNSVTAYITSAPSSKSSSVRTSEPRDGSSLPGTGTTTPASWSGGLWTPPAARTPQLSAEYLKDERREIFSSLNEGVVSNSSLARKPSTGDLKSLERLSLNDSPDHGVTSSDIHIERNVSQGLQQHSADIDEVAQLQSKLDVRPPISLSRRMSQKSLWGNRPSGDAPKRNLGDLPKRRWTVSDDQ